MLRKEDVFIRQNENNRVPLYFVISVLSISVGASLFSITGATFPLWIILALLGAYTWKISNYATVRIVIYLDVLVISLCGDTNFTLRFAIIDFIITFITILFNGHSIPRRYKLSPSWTTVFISGCVGGAFYAIDRTSFHVGIEVYGLLLAMIISSELISYIEEVDLKVILAAICTTNAGLMTIFWMSNTIQDLLTKTRALIYLLGDHGIRSNSLAGILVAFLIIIFTTRKYFSSKLVRLLNYIIITLDIVTLLLLQSRGGYIGITSAVLMAVVENIRNNRKRNRNSVINIIALVCFAIVLVSLPGIQDLLWEYVFKRFFSLTNTSDISNGRFRTYIEAYNMWKKHIFFGNGFLQFSAFNIANADPHNWVLGYLDSTGIFGTSAFAIFIIKCLRQYNSSGIISRAFRYSIFAQVIHGLFEPILTQNLPLSLFIVICIVSYFSVTQENMECYSTNEINEA